MRILTDKIIAVAISILMIVSIGASTTLFLNADAQSANNIPTYAYINVAPNPCGIGQSVTVNFWLAVPLADSELATNMTVVVTSLLEPKQHLDHLPRILQAAQLLVSFPRQLATIHSNSSTVDKHSWALLTFLEAPHLQVIMSNLAKVRP